MENMEKIKVVFDGGESRHGNYAVDFMIAYVDGVELYSEVPFGDNGAELENYDILKKDIIDQAIKNEIDINRLKFYYD